MDEGVTGVATKKADLRIRMAALRAGLDPAVRQRAAESIAAALDLPDVRAFLPAPGGVVAGFLPIKSEINPLPLMRRLADEGFRLALPRITPAGLIFHAYRFGDELAAGQLGTREPLATAALAAPDLVLAALLAFDRRGIRLGYGKAYYDRAFAALPGARRLGLAFSAQEIAHVPATESDLPLEAVLTEEGLVTVQR